MNEKLLLETVKQQALLIGHLLSDQPPPDVEVADDDSADVAELHKYIGDLQTVLDASRIETLQAKELLEKAEDALRRERRTTKSLSTELHQLQRHLDSEVSAKDHQIANLKRQIETDGKSISDMRAKLNRTAAKNDELRAELKALKTDKNEDGGGFE